MSSPPACQRRGTCTESSLSLLKKFRGQADGRASFAEIDYEPRKDEFCHGRGVFFGEHAPPSASRALRLPLARRREQDAAPTSGVQTVSYNTRRALLQSSDSLRSRACGWRKTRYLIQAPNAPAPTAHRFSVCAGGDVRRVQMKCALQVACFNGCAERVCRVHARRVRNALLHLHYQRKEVSLPATVTNDPPDNKARARALSLGLPYCHSVTLITTG
jgi:hypothetical protein